MRGSARAIGCGVVGLLLALSGPAAMADERSGTLRGVVVHVDDGDTVVVRVGERVERVRYAGIDAPEIAHPAGRGRPARGGEAGGAAATRVNASLVAGRPVTLELDVERRDRYGRLLAYVWVGRTMVNAELIARGYARALAVPPNVRYAALFAAREAEARDARRGLWATGALRPAARSLRGGRVHCAGQGALVSYERRSEGLGARGEASISRGRPWRSTRSSVSTPSIGCDRVSSSCRASRRWSACPSISTSPISAAVSGRPRSSPDIPARRSAAST
jgi:endonuclease YncB( thermonuclease family)